MEKQGNLGQFGEEMASKYLVRRGYKLILRNYRHLFPYHISSWGRLYQSLKYRVSTLRFNK